MDDGSDDGPGAPLSADHMRHRDQADQPSQLSLQVEIGDAGPDWPMVSIDVDGHSPFEAMAEGWLGFDPAQILAADAPLLPSGDRRHVALYRCSCGIAGCGVIAARIDRSSDGRRISWTDFRNYVGVFDRPRTDAGYDPTIGRSWPLAGFSFATDQYEAEVGRLTADMSWETPRRRTARRVQERLVDQQVLRSAPEFALQWVAPAWDADGVELSLWRSRGRAGDELVLLHLVSDSDDPEEASTEMTARLASVDPRDWPRHFPCRG